MKFPKLYRTAESSEIYSTESSRNSEASDANRYVTMEKRLVLLAVKSRASDVHIEPFSPEATRIRLRIDGILHNYTEISKDDASGLTTRIKIHSGMDISEKRLPQDGSFQEKLNGHPINIRVSSLPISYGEKLVLRFLDSENYLRPIENLGFLPEDEKKVRRMITRQQGLVLVTGPTACGKSTSLYSFINFRNDEKINIISVEDPVEIRIPGISQIQVNEKSGLTYQTGLKAILRQDPNIIMIGEIRDRETALAVCQAAMTGHLVLSTIHTKSSVMTLERLIEMGVPDYLVRDVIDGIISQRLLRCLCPECKKAYFPSKKQLQVLGLNSFSGPLYRPVGCRHCRGTGYYGRRAVFEVLMVTDKLRPLIVPNLDYNAWSKHYTSFDQSIRKLILEGITSYEEGLRTSTF